MMDKMLNLFNNTKRGRTKETIFDEVFEYVPYKSVATLNFGETAERNITKIFGKADKIFKNYGVGTTEVYFNSNSDMIQIFYDNEGKLVSISFAKSIKFIVYDKIIEINLDDFKISDLNKISDDFKLTTSYTDYASEKLGIDICFNFDGDYAVAESILFMSKEHYENEIEYLSPSKNNISKN